MLPILDLFPYHLPGSYFSRFSAAFLPRPRGTLHNSPAIMLHPQSPRRPPSGSHPAISAPQLHIWSLKGNSDEDIFPLVELSPRLNGSVVSTRSEVIGSLKRAERCRYGLCPYICPLRAVAEQILHLFIGRNSSSCMLEFVL